jgi:hypothetical protein
MSVAEGLIAGHILEDQFLGPKREEFKRWEAAISKVFASEALQRSASGLKDLGKSLGEMKAALDDIFNDPIKGFGVLSDYAERRLTQATGVGRDKILSSMPQLLTEPAGIYETYTVELARTCDLLLRKYGKSIADRRHALKRVADEVIPGMWCHE